MRIKNAIEKAEKVKINPYYDASAYNLLEIADEYRNDPIGMCNIAFRLGYLQGCKAEKKELQDRR